MNNSREKLLNDLTKGYRIFASFGWGDLGDGHISARDTERPECFWLLRYGVPFKQATPDDFVLVGPDGDLIEGKGTVNRPGFYIHQPILTARSDVMSAAHTHTPWGTPFSAEARIVEPITQEACFFYEDIALFDDEEVQVQSLEAGARIAQSLGRNRAIVLRNHGMLTVGESIAQAVSEFVRLERVAEAHLKAPQAQPIRPDAARFAKADLIRAGHDRASFDFLAAHHT